jgi:D-alanyl-D-alanine carboxypeptidase (penicillin-binding protein 5/6)
MSFRRAAASFVAMAAFLLYNDVALADMPKVTARSAVVIEQGSRRVLFEKNARERLPMASTTKIMTALVALENGDLSDVVQVSPEAAKVPGSSIYLKAGEELTLEQLLYGLMLQSGNDAATAIAQHIGGSAEGFLAMMNERAARLGLSDTHFASVCGLDAPGHYTSAYDLAVITAAAFDNADFRRIVATKSIYVPYDGLPNSRFLRNKNRILWSFEGANGVKTGYTGDAGRCFVGSAEREGMQLIAVVLNCGPMFEEASALMDDAFAQYDMVPVVEPRVALGQVPTGEGISGAVRYGAPQKVALPLDGEERMRVCTHLGLCAKPEAPVADGQLLGEGRVILDGQVLAAFPVVSLEADERKTYFWYVKRAIEEFLWRTGGEGNGCRSIWPPAESPRAGNARS